MKNFILVFILSIVNSLYGQNIERNIWPQFKGLNGTGVARENQNPPVNLEDEQKIIWKTPILKGESSPCIWGDRIFLTGYDAEKQQLHVMCYKRSSGVMAWDQLIPAKEMESFHRSASPADATPVTDGARLYVYFGSYGLICYDLNGNVIWEKMLPKNNDRFGSGTSPIITGNLVIVMVRKLPTRERYLLALDKITGEEIWKTDLLEAGYSTPVIWGKEVVIHCEGFIAGYDLKNGKRNWHILVRTHGESTPIALGDTLFVNAWHYLADYDFAKEIPEKELFLKDYDSNNDLRIDKDEFSGEIFMASENADGVHTKIWDWFDVDKNHYLEDDEIDRYLNFFKATDHGILAIKSGGHGNITESHILWRAKDNVAEVPSPLLYKEMIFVVRNGGFISCNKSSNGKLVYNSRIKMTSTYFSSPVAVNDHIYVASHNGRVTILEAGDHMKIIAENNLNEKILATPAIVDSKLYLRTDDHLYAFGD